jgi:hypothetical protein
VSEANESQISYSVEQADIFQYQSCSRHWETKPLMEMGDFDVCNKKKPMNITIKGKMHTSFVYGVSR